MITLNLFERTSALLALRMAANVVPGITDKEFLEHEIKKWLASQERLRQIEGEAYYDGAQDILKRERTVINETGDLEVVKNLMMTWILTFPGCGIIGFITTKIFMAIF